MRTIILTSVFWLLVLGAVLWVNSALDHSRRIDFNSDAILAMTQFLERDDEHQRMLRAKDMSNAMMESHDMRELKQAIVSVASKNYE